MTHPRWMEELRACRLCEWRCGANRLEGERGVCCEGVPRVASCSLHPAPPVSYTVFMTGCNFRCLHCQNYDIAHDVGETGSYRDPDDLAAEGVAALHSPLAHIMGADRLFFSGGEPTCSLSHVEQVVHEARRLEPTVKVNIDTNGFATQESFERLLDLATSITFDLRAVNDEVHRAMTGAPVAPVLRNAATLAAKNSKLWEFRVLVVPGINEDELEPLCALLADLDPSLPVAFLAFRPNFVLEWHPGTPSDLLDRAVTIARDNGLVDATWHGHAGLSGTGTMGQHEAYARPGAKVAGAYAAAAGCKTHPRDCGLCDEVQECAIRAYRPRRRT